MIIETDIVDKELCRSPVSLQDKTRVILRSVFQEAVDLKEAEAILSIVGKVVKHAAKRIDTKEFKS